MAKEVHVTASQADAARMIVERDSAHRKPTPEAIRKIAMARVGPLPKATNRLGPKTTVKWPKERTTEGTTHKGPWKRLQLGVGSATLSPVKGPYLFRQVGSDLEVGR